MGNYKGFTLIELMISLVLISVLLGVVFNKYRNQESLNKLIQLKSNVTQIENALMNHIRESCNTGSTITPTLEYFVTNGLLASAVYSVNPFNGTNLSFSINWSSPKTFTVLANMGTEHLANLYLNQSSANLISGSNLVWQYSYNSGGKSFESSRSFSKLFETECN